MALLCWANLLVNLVPLRLWRNSLGFDGSPAADKPGGGVPARLLARHVERGASRLPFGSKCLPRAMALSWMLRRRRIGHAVKIAVRPVEKREGADTLHAWVESGGVALIGDLPGPWLVTFSSGE